MTTTTATITYAVLNPIGGAPRADVCSVHGTHLGAVRRLSPGRVVGVVPAGTQERANVALTTVQEHVSREVRRVLGRRAEVQTLCDSTPPARASWTVVDVDDDTRPGAPTDALLPLLAELPDGAGREALVAAIVQASR